MEGGVGVVVTPGGGDAAVFGSSRGHGSLRHKKFGGGGGALHRPLFDPARLGGTGKAGAGSYERGWAIHPSPGFAPPTGATIAGGTPRTCVFPAPVQGGRSASPRPSGNARAREC